jgi:hypothetical protein
MMIADIERQDGPENNACILLVYSLVQSFSND